MFSFFKKKTREELLQERTDNVFLVLTSDNDLECTELETIQVMNNVRRKLAESLEAKKSLLMEQSVSSNQKAMEIKNALLYIE